MFPLRGSIILPLTHPPNVCLPFYSHDFLLFFHWPSLPLLAFLPLRGLGLCLLRLFWFTSRVLMQSLICSKDEKAFGWVSFMFCLGTRILSFHLIPECISMFVAACSGHFSWFVRAKDWMTIYISDNGPLMVDSYLVVRWLVLLFAR